MKTINEFRHTRKFCILGTDIQDIMLLVERWGKNLIAVATEDEGETYTVRVSDGDRVLDHHVQVFTTGISIIDTKVIIG